MRDVPSLKRTMTGPIPSVAGIGVGIGAAVAGVDEDDGEVGLANDDGLVVRRIVALTPTVGQQRRRVHNSGNGEETVSTRVSHVRNKT